LLAPPLNTHSVLDEHFDQQAGAGKDGCTKRLVRVLDSNLPVLLHSEYELLPTGVLANPEGGWSPAHPKDAVVAFSERWQCTAFTPDYGTMSNSVR
jgi:hypothetical protein